MSAKKAKLLRRLALGLAAQHEAAGHTVDQRGTKTVQANKSNQAIVVSSDPNYEPSQPKLMVVNRRDTFRGLIRSMKRTLKKGSK